VNRKFDRAERRRRPKTIVIEVLIILGGLISIAPLILALLTSFKPEGEIIHFQSLLPQDWTLENYKQVLLSPEETPILMWLYNSLFISSMVTLLVLTTTSMAAYSIARLRPPGSRLVLYTMIATLMIPLQVFLIPVYLILEFLHLIDTHWALILPAGSNVFGVFLLHQFFLGVPRELEEAAEIDGCSALRIYWHLVLPLSRPALATLGIFVFVGAWNDFLGPLVFLESTRKLTLPVGIALYQTSYFTEYGLTLAASILATLPAIVIFLLFQKRIIEGVSLTGLK
jgi:multiple sugar transport system permease protein